MDKDEMAQFRRYRGERYHGWIHPCFQPPQKLLEFPESIADFQGAEHLLDCRARQIFRLPLAVDGKLTSCLTYHFNNSSLGRSMRPTYSFRILQISRKLRQKGIDTLEVLAALKRRGEVLNRHSFVVAREITSVYEMASAGRHVFHIHPVIDPSLRLVSALARCVAALHNLGFFHGDLKTRHILFQPQRNPHHRFYFVDLEKCHHFSYLPERLRDLFAARDLIQFFASLPTEALKLKDSFLEEYLQALDLSSQRRKRLRKILSFYGPSGGLRQGETVLRSLFRKLKAR